MPYVPPNGSAVGIEFSGGYAPPSGASVNLELAAAVGDVRQAGIGQSALVGVPGVRRALIVRAHGVVTTALGSPGVQSDVPRISPPSIEATSVVGTPEYVRWPRTVDVPSIETPLWVLGDGRVRLLGGYNPPPASNISLIWLEGVYSSPPAANVILNFGALGFGRISGATLFDQSAFGAHTLAQPLGAHPVGIDSTSAFGAHAIGLLSAELRPAGWDSQAFGAHGLALGAAGVLVSGIAPPPQSGPEGERQIPAPRIDFRTRFLVPAGIGLPAAQLPDVHYVAFFTQFIQLGSLAPETWAPGVANIGFAERAIAPLSFTSTFFGLHNVAMIQEIVPVGWASSFVSTDHELDINLQRIFHATGSADPAGYGTTQVHNRFETVYPIGWLSQDISFPIAFNRDQHAVVSPFMDTNSDPTQWPAHAPFVENVDRMLGPGPWQSSRFSVIGNLVENAADALLPSGMDATSWGVDTFISHRIRYIGQQGWEGFNSSRFTAVYNAAVVIDPQGFGGAQVGFPSEVVNLNRTVKHVFPYEGETVGTAFIADRIRLLAPRIFNDIPSGIPEVRFNPYQIAPAGIAPRSFGAASLFEFFAIASPKSVNVHSVPWFGEPIVTNRNPELAVTLLDQAIYGNARVFNFNTHLTITAGDLASFGAHTIRDRTGAIVVSPSPVPVISVLHRVWNVNPDPPATQTIRLDGLVSWAVPSPVVFGATLFPLGLFDGAFGAPVFTRNTISVTRGIFNLDQVGTPGFILDQYLFPKPVPWPVFAPVENPGSSDENITKPRVTPHTIYAPTSEQATQQAKDNHPINQGNPLTDMVLGVPGVSNKNRSIGPAPQHASDPGLAPAVRFGGAVFKLAIQFIFPDPLRSQRFGIPMLNGPQFVDLDEFHEGAPPPLSAFGLHTVAPPPEEVMPELSPSGVEAPQFGVPQVELFVRVVVPQGIVHRGNPEQLLTSPWGTALVGFPRVLDFGGSVLSLWGNTWVSHKNRELPTQGWRSSTLEEEDLGSFSDRMTVRRRNPEGGVPSIGPDAVFGEPSVTHFVRTIFGRGALGYTAGSHVVSAVATIILNGWDSLEVGDIDRWEAGKIKPHGDDLSTVEIPRMLYPLRPAGVSDGSVGAPRMGALVYLAGMPEIGFMGPSISNPFGCTNRVVTPLPILSQQDVPQPEMA